MMLSSPIKISDRIAVNTHERSDQRFIRSSTDRCARKTASSTYIDCCKPEVSVSRRTVLALTTITTAESLIRLKARAEARIESLIPEGFDFGVVSDPTLAYEFLYPKQDLAGNALPVAFFRKPTQYAIAAPQSVKGRQRIVCGIAAFSAGIVIAVSVGPPSSELSEIGVSKWSAKDVANEVLADRSLSRRTVAGRIPLASVENTRVEEKSERTYWIYESVLAGAPTSINESKETYRRSLNISCARAGTAESWDNFLPLFELCASSFQLTSETKDYVSPDSAFFGLF